MAGPRPRTPESLPPPLPPESRTVGQLVAETLRLYGRRFWHSLALGIGPAVLVVIGSSIQARIWIPLMVTLGGLVLSVSYAGACFVGLDAQAEHLGRALVVGTLAFAPVPFLVFAFILPALAWLALVGLVVPVTLVEQRGIRASFRRAVELARADFVHTLGSLATLAIVVFLAQSTLIFVLQGTGDQTLRVAAFLGSLVVSPLLFLGAALLYLDQAARTGRGSG